MITSLHLSTAKSWRGGENQIYLLARGLKARGQRAVVAAPEGSPLLARCRAEQLEAEPLRVRGDLDIFGAWKLSRLLRKLRPQTLHLHDGHGILPGKLAARLSGLAGLHVFAHRRTVFPIKGRGKYGGRVDCVIAISQAVRSELIKGGIAAEKIRVVYSGMDFPDPIARNSAESAALRKKHGIPDEAFVIGHAAALTSEKRHTDMLAALELANGTLKGRGLPGVHLAIAGTGELQESLAAETERRGLNGHVHWLGFLTDLRPLWAVSDMAIYASEAEGLCTALIEAQGAGLPAAVSRAGGMVEVVEEGESGVIFNVGDSTQLSREILAFREDDARRVRMGKFARERARVLFSSDAMVDGVLKAYEEFV